MVENPPFWFWWREKYSISFKFSNFYLFEVCPVCIQDLVFLPNINSKQLELSNYSHNTL